MPIRVVCTQCKRGINAPDKYAGTKQKCPGCGAAIDIPSQLPAVAAGSPAASKEVRAALAEVFPARTTVVVPSDTMDCPYCGEEVKASAKKCRHCGEFFDEELRRSQVAPASYQQINVAAHPALVAGKPTIVTVQATSKLWKFIQLAGVLGIVIGVVMIFSGFGTTTPPGEKMGATGPLGMALVIVSLPVWIFGRMGAWWFHG